MQAKAMQWTRIGVIAIAAVLLLLAVFARRGPEPGMEPALRFDAEPRVTVEGVGEMSIEEYVQGVVGGEMGRLPPRGREEPTDWPVEAYAAQAILARTFILAWLEENDWKPIPTDVTQAQAYNPDNITERIRQGVESTRGEVMLDAEGRPFKSYFHSYAGGHTATAQEGLNRQDEPSWTVSKPVPENEYVPEDLIRWEAAIPLAEVQRALSEMGVDVGEVRQIRILETGPSGRMTTLSVEGTAGNARVHAADFRVALGPELLKSTRVDPESFRIENGMLIAKGTGFGHGVGLSQWDAYKMAVEGSSPEEIVQFFFKDIEIRQLWE